MADWDGSTVRLWVSCPAWVLGHWHDDGKPAWGDVEIHASLPSVDDLDWSTIQSQMMCALDAESGPGDSFDIAELDVDPLSLTSWRCEKVFR